MPTLRATALPATPETTGRIQYQPQASAAGRSAVTALALQLRVAAKKAPPPSRCRNSSGKSVADEAVMPEEDSETLVSRAPAKVTVSPGSAGPGGDSDGAKLAPRPSSKASALARAPDPFKPPDTRARPSGRRTAALPSPRLALPGAADQVPEAGS